MSDSDQLMNNGLTSAERNALLKQPESVVSDPSNLKSLIPEEVSHNKKAVIERLIALHLSQTT